MSKRFLSNFEEVGIFNAKYTDKQIKDEPMFFNCDLDFAYNNGNEITREFIAQLPLSWQGVDAVIDTRAHMLMKNWYPCIPGWHHDDVPRNTKNGQPNYVNPSYRSEHLMGLVNAHIAPTEFATGTIELIVPNDNIYKQWHPQVENAVRTGDMKLHKVKSGVYYEFNDYAFHQGTRAIGNGWRWFARVSRYTDRTKNITNEFRKQVQVYLEYPMEGW
jgi:hypothetical protein